MRSKFMASLPLSVRRLAKKYTEDGGPGSGNWGHRGRPGLVGGSGAGGGAQYRGGRADIKYVGTRKDWLNGLKGERQQEAANWLKSMAKKHGLDPKTNGIHAVEKKIVNSNSSEDLHDLLGHMMKARNWDKNGEALMKDNLSEDEKKLVLALTVKYGEDESLSGMPNTLNPKWSDEDERCWTELQIKAMGGPKSDREPPEELQYMAGLKERPKPPEPEKPKVVRNTDWYDKEIPGAYMGSLAKWRLESYLKGKFYLPNDDDAKMDAMKVIEQNVMDDVLYDPSRISFDEHVPNLSWHSGPILNTFNRPHADTVYDILNLKGTVLGWDTYDISMGLQKFDTLTENENKELVDLLNKYQIRTSDLEYRTFGNYQGSLFYFTKVPTAEQADAIRYFQLKDKALGGTCTPKEEYDQRRSAEKAKIEEAKRPSKIGINSKASGPEMDFEKADHGSGNPGYETDDPQLQPPPHHVNCQTCVVAYEARRRGYDVTAKGNYYSGNDPCYKLSRFTSAAWIDPETGVMPRFIAHGKKNAAGVAKWIDDNVKPGERYNLGFFRKFGGGHIVTVERNAEGKPIIFDPQNGKIMATGKAEIREYLSDRNVSFASDDERNGSELQLLRVDNLAFNLELVNQILE